MKDNRQSMLPKKEKNYNTVTSSNQSNIKATNDSKARKSSNFMMYPRATTLSSLNKSNDPRPIKESSYQEECITKILDFLIKESYDRIISKRELTSPTAKDFTNIFLFILTKIRPDWNVQINKLDEDVIPILNELRYPGYITKNHLISPGAPNTWPHLLAVLTWLCELANYLRWDFEETEEEKVRESVEFIPIPTQEKNFEESYKDYLFEGFKASSKQSDNFAAIENFQKKTDELVNMNHVMSDKLKIELTNYNHLIEDLDRNFPDLQNTKSQFEAQSRELNNLGTMKTNLEKKWSDLLTTLDKESKIYESKCEKNKEDIKIIDELENTKKNQKVSYEGFEKLKHSRVLLEKQNMSLNCTKNELTQSVWNCQTANESIITLLNEKIKNINSILDRQNIPKGEIILLIANEVNSLKLNEPPSFDLVNASNCFLALDTEIKNLISNKNSDLKEKEELLINLKSDLRKMEDTISEANERLSQKNSEVERENGNLAAEKEKYIQLNAQKNEEIKRLNESSAKAGNLVSEKEKELEESKQKENELNSIFIQEEEKFEIFGKELENEYIETCNEVLMIKNENIKEIRKTSVNMNEIFTNIQHTFKTNYKDI